MDCDFFLKSDPFSLWKACHNFPELTSFNFISIWDFAVYVVKLVLFDSISSRIMKVESLFSED